MFDPTEATSNAHQLLEAVYDTLLVQTVDGDYEPALATEATIVDASTIEIELREGVEFSDGTPVDAEALKFNLERNNEANNQRGLRAEILVALDNVEVTGPLTATIHLKTPTAGVFYNLLAGPETMMVSPTAVRAGQDMNKEPVGAGPFLLESAAVESRVVLTKNPTYWNADQVHLAGMEFIHLLAGPNLLNALNAGQLDMAAITTTDMDSVRDPVVAQAFDHPAMVLLNMCKREGPLSDVRVRQAMAFATDRDGINQRVFGGRSEPAWSLRRSADRFTNPELDGVYERDLDRAADLLAEAGYADGFPLGMIVQPGVSQTVGELLQAQLGEAGIDVELQLSSNPLIDFYIEGRQPTFPISHVRAGLDAWTVLFLPGAFANVCGYSNPELEQSLARAMALDPASDEAVDAWHEMSEIVARDLPIIPLVFHVEAQAHNEDRVGGLDYHLSSYGYHIPNLAGVYIKE